MVNDYINVNGTRTGLRTISNRLTVRWRGRTLTCPSLNEQFVGTTVRVVDPFEEPITLWAVIDNGKRMNCLDGRRRRFTGDLLLGEATDV